MKPKTRDRAIKAILVLLLANLIVTGSLFYAVIHLQPTILTDTVSFLDKLWPF